MVSPEKIRGSMYFWTDATRKSKGTALEMKMQGECGFSLQEINQFKEKHRLCKLDASGLQTFIRFVKHCSSMSAHDDMKLHCIYSEYLKLW